MKALKFLQETIQIVLKSEPPTPMGAVIAFYGLTVPKNYLLCDGSEFDKDEYPELFALLGDNKTPDLRKRLIEGADGNGFTLGTYTDAGLPNISGNITHAIGWLNRQETDGALYKSDGYGGDFATYGSKAEFTLYIDASRSSPIYGKSDTVQPATIALNYIIRAK